MRILFVKTSSLGDVIHHCPAVSDALLAFPGAVIDWVVEDAFVEIAAMHPGVRRAIPVAVRTWRKRLLVPSTWREILAFRRALRSETYDVVIDTQGLLKSALVAATARGTRHGFDARSAREPVASRFYDVRHAVPRDMHAVARNRQLTASALGVAPGGACDYGLVPHGDSPMQPGRSYCVLLSMTSRSDKLWPEANWVALLKHIAARGWEAILPWGSLDEQARCERIRCGAGAGIVPPRMPLAGIASVMRDAKVVVGVDTGLSHLAAALGVPAIGLYCASDPSLTGLYGGRTRNLGGPHASPAVHAVIEAVDGFA